MKHSVRNELHVLGGSHKDTFTVVNSAPTVALGQILIICLKSLIMHNMFGRVSGIRKIEQLVCVTSWHNEVWGA